jgi:adhesin/invasin
VRFEQADLSVTKSVEPAGPLEIGQQITFTLNYYNYGPMAVTDASLEDTINGNGLDSDWLRDMFFSTTPSSGTPGLGYSWYLGALASGQGGTITFGGTLNLERSWPSLTVVTNTATIGSAIADLRLSNNTSSVTTTVVTGPPVTLTLMAVPDSTWVLTGTSDLRAMVYDVYGNPAPNGTPVTFTTSLGGFPSVQQRVRYTTNGLATQVLTAGALGGTADITATVGSLVATTQVQFRWVPGAPASIRFLSLEPGVIPDCVGEALAKVIVLDHYGNPVRDGTVVSFMVAPTGEANPIDGGRTTNGIAQAIIGAGMEPVPAVVKALVGDQHGSFIATFPITFIVGPPDRLEGLSAQPPQLPVGGNNSTIRVRVLDCTDRYPVADGTVVTFTLASGLGALAPFTTTTANGWAYATLTSPNDTGSALVRVNAGEREGTVLVTYIPGQPFDVVVMASPLSIAANGVSTSTIVAEVRDQYGNFVADGTRLEFSTTLGRFVTGPASTAPTFNTSTLGGSARAILISSNTPGVARVGAEAGGKRGEAFVDFYYVPTPTPTPTPARVWLYLPLIKRNAWR